MRVQEAMCKAVLLDTNFLLAAVQFKVDVFEKIREFGRPIMLSACISELEKLSRKKGKAAEEARTVLTLIKKKKLKVVKTRIKSADSAITDYAVKHETAVATNDRKLIKALKKKGIMVIRLRQKRYLVCE